MSEIVWEVTFHGSHRTHLHLVFVFVDKMEHVRPRTAARVVIIYMYDYLLDCYQF
jgi:hypothetical protein